MEELRHSNQTLEVNVLTLWEWHHKYFQIEDEVIYPQNLLDEISNAIVPENFKLSSLVKFEGKSDPRKHIASINTQMVIIGTSDSLNFKILYNTFNEAALRWLTNLFILSITSYQYLSRKQIHQFSE